MTFPHPFRMPLSSDEGSGNSFPDPSTPPVGDMVAWYRAQEGITLTAGGITQWNDISGNGHHLIQDGLASRRPTISTAFLNGEDVAAFDGQTQFVYNASTPALELPFTILALYRSEYTFPSVYGATGRAVYDSNTVDTAMLHQTRPASGSVFTRARSATNRDVYTNASNPENSWEMVEVHFNGATSNAWHNGVQTLTNVDFGANGGLTGFRIGVNGGGTSGQSWLGKIAEVMIWQRALTTEERNKYVAYVVHRYNPDLYDPPASPGGGAPPECGPGLLLVRDKVYGAYCWNGIG